MQQFICGGIQFQTSFWNLKNKNPDDIAVNICKIKCKHYNQSQNNVINMSMALNYLSVREIRICKFPHS